MVFALCFPLERHQNIFKMQVSEKTWEQSEKGTSFPKSNAVMDYKH